MGAGMIRFDNSWMRDLPGTFLRLAPDVAPAPQLRALNLFLAKDLGLDIDVLREGAAGWFSGAVVPDGADPIALAYAGHQFGGFSPQLGDVVKLVRKRQVFAARVGPVDGGKQSVQIHLYP